MERINKFLARAGVASRRQAEKLLTQGRVTVNQVVITTQGLQIDPNQDQVRVDGELVHLTEEYQYGILHKPPGYLTTVKDPFGRQTVMELLPPGTGRIYPVGRLDLDTSGLLFFTNDGDLALAMAHPRHLVEKVYIALVKEIPNQSALKKLEEGILLEEGLTTPALVQIESVEKGNANLKITLREGRKRQVKRMLGAVGHPVINLKRIAMGPLILKDLPLGQYRKLEAAELDLLLQLKVDLNKKKQF